MKAKLLKNCREKPKNHRKLGKNWYKIVEKRGKNDENNRRKKIKSKIPEKNEGEGIVEKKVEIGQKPRKKGKKKIYKLGKKLIENSLFQKKNLKNWAKKNKRGK